ncbi:MAG: acyltransferase [Desulfobacteraceae bacterium]|nr:acyltransferase [Desulfobacteraceae bacterium]
MRKDHRPFVVKKAWVKFEKTYTRHFLKPQLEQLGNGYRFMRPWHVKLFGGPISIGEYATVVAAPDSHVRLSVWSDLDAHGGISIGRYALICPGVRISSARRISIADSCMIANGAYITDSDWHGIYDRVGTGEAAPVTLEKNTWIGDSAIICKGVTVGENSIVGAGSVVVDTIPANTVAAGNPARVVKQLDPEKTVVSRRHFFKDADTLSRRFTQWDRAMLENNTFREWLRHLLIPRKGE